MPTISDLEGQTITCSLHGVSQATFVCQHLVQGRGIGFFHASEEVLRPDAWCMACNQVLIAHDGEWTEETDDITGVTAICSNCYDQVRARNEASGQRNRPTIRPMLEEDGWELDSAVRRNRLYPKTFHIPSEEETRNLKVGDLVKLVFLIATQDDNGLDTIGTERMWVIVQDITDTGYRGRLDNQPKLTEKLKPHDLIEFGWEHVAATFVRKDDPRHPSTWKTAH